MDTRGANCGILEVGERSNHGKYLGLPMIVGRKKNEVFNFLCDRVKQKLQVWRNTAMSKADKYVLLQTAAQSIPTFWMNLLRILNEVCNIIQRQINSLGGEGVVIEKGFVGCHGTGYAV